MRSTKCYVIVNECYGPDGKKQRKYFCCIPYVASVPVSRLPNATLFLESEFSSASKYVEKLQEEESGMFLKEVFIVEED